MQNVDIIRDIFPYSSELPCEILQNGDIIHFISVFIGIYIQKIQTRQVGFAIFLEESRYHNFQTLLLGVDVLESSPEI